MKSILKAIFLLALLMAANGSPYNRVRRTAQFGGVNTLPFYLNALSTWLSTINSFNNGPQFYSPGFNGFLPLVYSPSYDSNGYRPFYSSIP
ncbi:hypothetical protein GHT06_010265 [Daphnia sinensis]|uniref:Secreted protein n=1 Tax=Daphnia sinensis TaxID=1820382 RepID=A0AAD5LHE2_9CRUS|nr:hypothetical protein GHT06_010265 [Daphnia sinensis]